MSSTTSTLLECTTSTPLATQLLERTVQRDAELAQQHLQVSTPASVHLQLLGKALEASGVEHVAQRGAHWQASAT